MGQAGRRRWVGWVGSQGYQAHRSVVGGILAGGAGHRRGVRPAQWNTAVVADGLAVAGGLAVLQKQAGTEHLTGPFPSTPTYGMQSHLQQPQHTPALDAPSQPQPSRHRTAPLRLPGHLGHHGEGGARLPLVLHRPHKWHAQVARLAAVLLGCKWAERGAGQAAARRAARPASQERRAAMRTCAVPNRQLEGTQCLQANRWLLLQPPAVPAQPDRGYGACPSPLPHPRACRRRGGPPTASPPRPSPQTTRPWRGSCGGRAGQRLTTASDKSAALVCAALPASASAPVPTVLMRGRHTRATHRPSSSLPPPPPT